MKKKLTFKIWLLIILVALSLITVFGIPPKFLEKGVLITSVDPDSTAFEQGLRQGQIITHMDGILIESVEEYNKIIHNKFPVNQSIKTTITTKNSEIILFSKETPKMTVSKIPKSNIKLGLDLAGSARALIQAQDRKLSSAELKDLADIIENRLNVFGISDIRVVPITDLFGDNRLSIEIAGATPTDLEELISKQGKFEAKIGNETVFIGGDKDIASVCRNDATCAGIETCQQGESGAYFCNFRFTIYLSEEAAKRHAEITEEIGMNETNPGYLEKPLDLYLDDSLVQSLLISEGLKGQVTTQISISGSESGETLAEAEDAANEEMHKLQTILITGSLPYKLEIVKIDTISPRLGKEFTTAILIAGLVAILAVAIVVFFRYRKFKSSIALLITSVSEVIIVLGLTTFFGVNYNLPAIAGILATIGVGIDSQIIILDESGRGDSLSLKQKLKRAMSIIMGAYLTAVVALIPLFWAAAGFFKGFAITTFIGLTVGVLITRPAFADMLRRIEE